MRILIRAGNNAHESNLVQDIYIYLYPAPSSAHQLISTYFSHKSVQMFAPNVGQASRAGRTEKKKKDYTTPLDL